MESLQELTNALSNGTIPDFLRPPLPQDWGFATPTQNPITIISGTGIATEFKFGRYIRRVYPNKSPLTILEKRERGRIQGLPNFGGTPYYLRDDFQFCKHIHRIDRNKSPLKISVKQPWRPQGVPTIFRAPKYSAHRAVIFAIAQLSCYNLLKSCDRMFFRFSNFVPGLLCTL